MSPEKLRDCSKKELAKLARKHHIPGWHAMRKDQLVKALAIVRNGRKHAQIQPPPKRRPNQNGLSHARIVSRLRVTSHQNRLNGSKHAGHRLHASAMSNGKDRIMAVACDPHWLHVSWELTSAGIHRAEAALREEWHAAKPILRVLDVSSEDTTANSHAHLEDIELTTAACNWYIQVSDAPRSFRVDIGYVSRFGKFYAIAHSNVANTPRTGVSDVIQESWEAVQAQKQGRNNDEDEEDGNGDGLRYLFDERLRLPLSAGSLSRFNARAAGKGRHRGFWFELDAELIVYGSTQPGARVTLQGKSIQPRPDGTFTMRFALPDKRVIIPATAVPADGSQERTVVIAIERNTKELEPLMHDSSE